MISFDENSLVGTITEIPGNNPTVPIYQPTPYDYLALLPALIAAITRLILALKKK